MASPAKSIVFPETASGTQPGKFGLHPANGKFALYTSGGSGCDCCAPPGGGGECDCSVVADTINCGVGRHRFDSSMPNSSGFDWFWRSLDFGVLTRGSGTDIWSGTIGGVGVDLDCAGTLAWSDNQNPGVSPLPSIPTSWVIQRCDYMFRHYAFAKHDTTDGYVYGVTYWEDGGARDKSFSPGSYTDTAAHECCQAVSNFLPCKRMFRVEFSQGGTTFAQDVLAITDTQGGSLGYPYNLYLVSEAFATPPVGYQMFPAFLPTIDTGDEREDQVASLSLEIAPLGVLPPNPGLLAIVECGSYAEEGFPQQVNSGSLTIPAFDFASECPNLPLSYDIPIDAYIRDAGGDEVTYPLTTVTVTIKLIP